MPSRRGRSEGCESPESPARAVSASANQRGRRPGPAPGARRVQYTYFVYGDRSIILMAMTPLDSKLLTREILLGFWKVHILHNAAEHPIIGQWVLTELRRHGYDISPGTLYPLL